MPEASGWSLSLLMSIKICIDPGHGGNDSGAGGPTGLEEANTALAISHLIANKLSDAEFEIKMTRTTDVFIELGKRCEIANKWGADYFVSVHLNSNGSTAVGIETLYTSESGRDLAITIQDVLIEATGDTDRGVKERDDLYVLNGTDMPAVLLELGFISHPETEANLKTTEYQQILADAVVIGIREYLEEI